MRAGEMWVVNDPYVSGTHLNDVTRDPPDLFPRRTLAGYAANKAHHTDVGGMVPGSMSADAADLFAEGSDRAADAPGRERCAIDVDHRAVPRELAHAAGAQRRSARANCRQLHRRTARCSNSSNATASQTIDAAIERMLDDSETRMRAALRELGEGIVRAARRAGRPRRASLRSVSRCELTLARRHARISIMPEPRRKCTFPMNAVYGVTLSGVYYALRAVTDPTIPMNEGCFRPVTVDVPEGTLLNPRRPAPVSRRQRRNEHAQRRRGARRARASRARARPGCRAAAR